MQNATPNSRTVGMRRRQILGVGGLARLSLWQNTMGRNATRAATKQTQKMPYIPPVSVTTASGIRIHGVQTAWIAIKTAHYALCSPEALRFFLILTDAHWTEAKPVLSWIIEHPEGLIVIDSGERAAARDLERYFSCVDPVNRFILTRNFRVHSTPQMELGSQLERLNLSPREVRYVVQTHLHFDHADGFAAVPKAKVLVARAEIKGHARMPLGAVSCTRPPNLEFVPVDYRSGSYASFGAHHPLTRAGDVLLVPTHGHSYGHQSVVLRDLHHDYLFAGDVTFDEGQLERRTLGGISHDLNLARDSLERTRKFVQSQKVVYLPSHDPDSLERLAQTQETRFKGD